ncbi:MAG: RluA family pseudouridine synthase [Gemmatimonadota bacterium]|nr:RluA family pseudouridine synthase [Gemmatimonadota bacterium]MDE2872223.1 RluA family pseudouridine synthase [Gemmatimonadota bacterium]
MSNGSGGESPQGGEARHCWTAGGEAAGRLDGYVAARLGLSRSRAAALIGEGRVLVDGRAAKKSEAVAEGRVVEVVVPAPAPSEAEPEDIALDVVFEDRDLVVVNKQAGLVVHPAPGHPRGTLVNALLHHVGDLSGIGGTLRPGIVHRLDRDTSGLMVVAKSDRAHRGLSEALRARRVKRVYLAALWGALGERDVLVDRPIGRHPRDRTRMAVVAGGRPSRTRFRHLETWDAASLCEAALDTGRTHQIRVHAAAIGHPVVGDTVYGAGRERGFAGAARRRAAELAGRARRQFLHARRLGFEHPVTGEAMNFSAPLPPDLEAVRAWAVGRG